MAKVEWSAGIDSVSGALSNPGSDPQHKCNKMLLATHRVAPTENPNCNRLYLRKKTKIKITSQNVLAAQERFAAVAAMVKVRKSDLSKMATDQAAYRAQKDQPGGKTTLKAYYWMVCGEEYDEAQAQAGE